MVTTEVTVAWKTRAGHRHQVEGLENEDAVFVTEQHPTFDAVLMVADGMGGHPRPGEASEAAVRAAREFLFDRRRLEAGDEVLGLLAAALHAAHQSVRRLGSGATARPPGTTLSLAVLADGALYAAHVGDGSLFLMREGQVRIVAGGEERRTGNRPAQYLGQAPPLEIEQRRVPLEPGDRLLLCTDGLTRYFREAGPEALERVLGREGVEIQAIASQLTAHSRPDEYDDDTTVALVEVRALSQVPPRPAPVPRAEPAKPVPARTEGTVMPERRPAEPRGAGSVVPLLAAGLAGAGLLAAGFVAGRGTASHPAAPVAPVPGGPRAPAASVTPEGFPAGNLVLLDELGGRVYTLSTRGGAPGSDPITFQALAVGAGKRLAPAGRFRLDPVRNELTDESGHTYPVEVDSGFGSIRLLRGGTLIVKAATGTRVFLDGRDLGPAPQRVTAAAGRHQVRLEARNWTNESEVEVLPGRATTLNVGAP